MKSIMQAETDRCYLCGSRRNLETHHVLGGIANRRLSTRYGLTVRLCQRCHTGNRGAQYEKDLNILLKQEAQRRFEAIHGHEKWMETFRKNYL